MWLVYTNSLVGRRLGYVGKWTVELLDSTRYIIYIESLGNTFIYIIVSMIYRRSTQIRGDREGEGDQRNSVPGNG